MIGSVTVKARPLRLAYLVDPNNGSQVREAIRLSSSLWGGTYFPIVPLYKRMPATWADKPLKAPSAATVIRGYIDAFDPDVLVQLSRDVPDFIKGAGREIVPASAIWQAPNTPRPRTPQYGIGIFELLGDVFEKYFRYKAKYPVQVALPRPPRNLSLFWTSVFGELPPAMTDVLNSEFREALEIKDVDVEPSRFRELMARNVLFPRRIVQGRLSPTRRGGPIREHRVFFMDASRVDDIVDFWNLRALGSDTIAVPKQLESESAMQEYVAGFLISHHLPWPHNPDVYDSATFVRSRNSTMEEMQKFATGLSDKLPAVSDSRNVFYSLQHWYPRIWDEWARDKDSAAPYDFHAAEQTEYDVAEATPSTVPIKLALPDFAEEYVLHSQVRCANEVEIRAYGSSEYVAEVLPKTVGDEVLQAVAGPTSLHNDWRIDHNGLVRLVRHESREHVTIPVSEDVMFAWLSDLGWKAKLSAPGLLAKQIFRQLDGNVAALRNETLLGLLEHMNGGNVQRDGKPAEKQFVQPELERDLEIGVVKNRLSASGGWYDYYVDKKIFRVGIRTRCPHCLRNSWLPLQGIAEVLNCPRCLREFPAVNNLTLGKWTYKTAGPFSVPAYADGAYAVLLALGFFCGRGASTVRTTPLLSFKAESPDKVALEADFALLWEESVYGEQRDGVIFGECKTYGEFEARDYDRMRYLAKTFPGAVLVFCTLRKSLTAVEVAKISRIARAGRKYWKADRPVNPVLVLTGNELLHWQTPPYCWSDDLKQRFQHLAGLLQDCNATQQIYLGLPSWEADWQEMFEKKRRKIAARMAIGGRFPLKDSRPQGMPDDGAGAES